MAKRTKENEQAKKVCDKAEAMSANTKESELEKTEAGVEKTDEQIDEENALRFDMNGSPSEAGEADPESFRFLDGDCAVTPPDWQINEMIAVLDGSEEATTPAKAQYEAASAGTALGIRNIKKLLAKALTNVERIKNTKDQKKQGNLVDTTCKLLTETQQATIDLYDQYIAERTVAKGIAKDSDRFRQSVTNVSRWAFGTKSDARKALRKAVQAKKHRKATKTAEAGAGTAKAGSDTRTDSAAQESTPSSVEGQAKNTDTGLNSPKENTGEASKDAETVKNSEDTAAAQPGQSTQSEQSEQSTQSEQSAQSEQSTQSEQSAQSEQSKSGEADPNAVDANHRYRTTLAKLVAAGKLPIEKTVKHPLSEEQRKRLVSNGYEHGSYELVVIPPRFAVIDHQYEKGVDPHAAEVREDGKRTVETAKIGNEKLASKSYLSPSLAAMIASMWVYFGLTKYRMQILTAMMGFPINSSVMGNLLGHLDDWITPLYELLKLEALGMPVLVVDETTWHTMEHLKSGERRDSRIFAYVTDPKGGKPIRIYEYQPDRRAEHVTEFLEGYRLIIVTDGYQGYDCVKNVIHCLCIAHLRRKFRDAVPKNVDIANTKAGIGFDFCSDIIMAEVYMDDQYGPLTPEMRVELRHKITKPIVDKFFQWCESMKEDDDCNGNLMEAINYALNHREELCNFLDHGEAPPTSNLVESALRPLANFRKICMHTGNDDSTKLMMKLATILQTAAINNLNPQQYLEVYLEHMLELGKNPPQEKLAELLPWASGMQEQVNHLDLPKRKRPPLTEAKIKEAAAQLQKTMMIAYSSSATLRQTPIAEWLDFHWDADVVTPPRLRQEPPKQAPKNSCNAA